MVKAILERREAEAELAENRAGGLENILVNDIAISKSWSLEKVWRFRKLSHINLQELAAVQKLAYEVAKQKSGCRIVNFVDSNVVRCVLSNGRFSSRAIGAMLRRFRATFLASDSAPNSA